MKHLFVPYELALLAKEKGFNEPCLGLYLDLVFYNHVSDKFSHAWEVKECKNEGMKKWACSAPLYQQLVDWFREKYKIVVWVETSLSITSWNYRFKLETHDNKHEGHRTSDYYEALTAALTEAFKLLSSPHENTLTE